MAYEILKLVGLVSVMFALVYFIYFKIFPTTEGLENKDGKSNALAYAELVKTTVIQLQDQLLIAKYKKDYENIIIHMDDYINLLMLQNVLGVNMADGGAGMAGQMSALNTLHDAKQSLNTVMEFVGK